MARKKIIIGIALIIAILLCWSVVFYSQFILQNRNDNDYVPHFDNIPVSVEANIRKETNGQESLFYLDLEITNNGKKAIIAMNYYADYTYYVKRTDSPAEHQISSSISSLPIWDSLIVIGGGSTKKFSMPIGALNYTASSSPMEILKVDCDLYITWINYAWHRDQWGDKQLLYNNDNFILENVPKFDVVPYVA